MNTNLTEVRYQNHGKTIKTEWMYIHENGHTVIFKEFKKAENYLLKSLRFSSWNTNLMIKPWKGPSSKPKNCKISTKKTRTKGIKSADEYLRAKLKNTNPYKLEDVGSTVDFESKPKKKSDWRKKFTG